MSLEALLEMGELLQEFIMFQQAAVSLPLPPQQKTFLTYQRVSLQGVGMKQDFTGVTRIVKTFHECARL